MLRTITPDDAKKFVGGGTREISDAERDQRAATIAESNNAYVRWAEGRDLADRIATTTATVTPEDGEPETVAVPLVSEEATTKPEGFQRSSKKKGDK